MIKIIVKILLNKYLITTTFSFSVKSITKAKTGIEFC